MPPKNILIPVILRFLALIAVAVGLVLVAIGPWLVCSGDQCYKNYQGLHINNWNYINTHYNTHILMAQYAVIGAGVAVGIAAIALMLYRLWKGTRRTWLVEFTVLIVCASILLGFGGLECWFAMGFGVMDHSEGHWNFTVIGWAAAAACLFLAAVLMLIDAIFVLITFKIQGTADFYNRVYYHPVRSK